MIKTDVCVIGCGIIGATVSLALTEAKKSVLSVEHGALALRGSTLAGFGALTPYSDPFFVGETAEFAAHSLELYKTKWLPNLYKRTGQNVPLSETGLMQIFSNEKKMEAEIKRYESDCIPGYRPDILNEASLRASEPAIDQECVGALYHPEPWIDLSLYIGALEVAIHSAKNLRMALNTTIRDISVTSEGSFRGTLTNGSKFSAGHIVVCTGLTAPKQDIFKHFPLRWVRGDGVSIRTNNNLPLFKNNIYSSPGFISPRATGEMLLGSTYVDEGVKPEGYPVPDRDTISFESLSKISASCKKISSHLKDCSVERLWRGWRPGTADDYPILSADAAQPNIIYAQGFLGLGITLSVAVADAITNYIGSSSSDCFPNEMSAERFK